MPKFVETNNDVPAPYATTSASAGEPVFRGVVTSGCAITNQLAPAGVTFDHDP